ncbi:hypothetical protein [Parasulfitobacter algicola]|uniref:Lipoprotein n=1 Tax=Parasulfitobacter algicola TaxID=2614809 RepID=A0ABX2ILB1_9RHOB|nr:hypothetical protein [Sulfitobacter algicola]NSX53654.1 hypothetical protein [Sulfitobacter algicola]
MRFAILSAFILSACTSIVPTTALRLSTISPFEADPAGFALAITMPKGFDIEPKSARLVFIVTRNDTYEARKETFVLDRIDADQTVFRVAPNDLDALRAIQAVAKQWKAESNDTNGSLGVTLTPCKLGAGPAEDARVSVAIRVKKDGPFMPLVRNAPIAAVAEQAQLHQMGNCSIVRN